MIQQTESLAAGVANIGNGECLRLVRSPFLHLSLSVNVEECCLDMKPDSEQYC